MKQSQLFTKTKKEAPKDEISVNAQLLIRAGYIDKLTAGVYSFLPLGKIVLEKIENIIRQEMNAIGGQEVLLPALTPKENWEQTGRWKYEEMFKIKSRSEKEYSLGWTHEEIITPLVKKFVNSYKDLPLYVYQIQNKFRDELRAKSGILRGREFMMKDLYSFHRDEKDLDEYYDKVIDSYFKIFEKCGLKKETFLTMASGGSFSKYSHEFQAISESGEDEIYICSKCALAINKEIVVEEKGKCPKCNNEKLEIKKAIEVGNIFKLGKTYSEAFNLNFKNEEGKEDFITMGCYGIGPSRLMGTITEVSHDEKGIIWPETVAPFKIHLIAVGHNPIVKENSDKIYQSLKIQGIEVLYDDREGASAGEKFADSDLIGIPYRVVISEKTLTENSVEVKQRKGKQAKLVKIKDLLKEF